MESIRKRWLTGRVEAALEALPVVVLTGARQTGKTTLASGLPGRRSFRSLDDLDVLGQARSDPESLLVMRPLTVDEVQRAPQLLLPIKRHVDLQRVAGDFLLTGSANLLLMDAVADSLAGRAVYLELPPFCPSEWNARPGGLGPLDLLFEEDFDPTEWPDVPGNWQGWLLAGGFPAALSASKAEARHLWFTGYVQTYLERDLRQLSAVSNLPDFQRIMSLAAHRCARLLNQSELARDAALPQPTAHRYLNLLETGCLLVRLSPFSTNPSTGLVKAKKLMWSDCGLAAWLAGVRGPSDLTRRLDLGFWLEQAIFQTLQSWRAMDPSRRRIHFWRDRSGREVDFVLEKDGLLVGLEIKASRQVPASDADGIEAFRQRVGRSHRFLRGAVLHAGSARPLGPELWALPWAWMLPAEGCPGI